MGDGESEHASDAGLEEPSGIHELPERTELAESAAEQAAERSRNKRPLLAVIVLVAVVVAVAVGFVLSRDNDPSLEPLASETCAELDGAIMLQVSGILNGAISEAESLGYTPVDLGDAMRKECPSLMRALDDFSDEQQAEDNLPRQMELEITRCTSDGVEGTLVNGSDYTATVFIDVFLESSSGVLVGDSGASVNGIRPGQTAEWEAGVFGTDYDSCRAEVESAYIDD